MRTLILSFFIIAFIACGSRRQVEDTAMAEVEDPAIAEVEPNTDVFQDMGEQFLNAMINKDLKGISTYYPTVDVAKQLSKKETQDLSDEQIIDQMLDPLKQRFENNIKAIQNNMMVHKVQIDLFAFTGYKYHETDEPGTIPRVLSLNFNYDGKDISIPVTVAKIGKSWYIFEILSTTRLFD